jgi:hypothetical protein
MVLIPCMNLALSLPLYMKSNIPIYDLSSFEHYKNQGVYIGQFGAYAKLHKHLHSTHGHSFYHMVYFSKGTGVQHIDFKQFDIKAGQIYFMIPGRFTAGILRQSQMVISSTFLKIILVHFYSKQII